MQHRPDQRIRLLGVHKGCSEEDLWSWVNNTDWKYSVTWSTLIACYASDYGRTSFLNSGFLSVIIAGLTPLIVLTLLFLGIGLHAVAWQPPAIWTDDFGTGEVTAVVGDNGVYAGGSTGANLFVSRYDLGGQRVWKQDFGNSTYDEVTGIALGTDGVYVAGTGFIQKYNLNGTMLWTIRGVGASMSVNMRGVFVGYYESATKSTLLRAYDSNGNSLWTDFLGNDTSVISTTTHSGDSRVYVLGENVSYFLQSYNSDGTLNWKENLTCSCQPVNFAADASGIYVVGYPFQGAISTGTLAKYDFVGSQLWMKNFDSPDGTTVGTPRISVDSSGIYLALTTTRSGFLLRYNGNGNQVWTVEMPLTGNAVSAGQDGVYVGGAASNNAVLSKYGQSSSLVLFGVNPPFSFGLVALLGAVVVLSLLWLRRQRKRGIRRPRSAVPYSPPKAGEDDSKWVRRPP